MKFKMPWPPSVNGYWKPFRNRLIISKRGREYRKQAIFALQNLSLYNIYIDFELSVKLILNPPTLRKYDIDNFQKALFDAFTHGGLWVDDVCVVELLILKGKKTKNGNVEVFIEKK